MRASPTLTLGLLLAALGLAAPSLALDLDLKPAPTEAPSPAVKPLPGWSQGYDSKRFSYPPSEQTRRLADQALQSKQEPKTPVDCQSHPGYAYCEPKNAERSHIPAPRSPMGSAKLCDQDPYAPQCADSALQLHTRNSNCAPDDRNCQGLGLSLKWGD
ncbi:hypothetical protein ACUXVY_14745 [Chromobacterium haemolyticum]|uniref:hypothetical protein n=1 Tax=Chromobacterium haemolyticum TaxID=394935 RepID=UPI004057C7B2